MLKNNETMSVGLLDPAEPKAGERWERSRGRFDPEGGMTLNLAAGAGPVAGYARVRPLGRGGFGAVWEAPAPGGVRVALKFIRRGPLRQGLRGIRLCFVNIAERITHAGTIRRVRPPLSVGVGSSTPVRDEIRVEWGSLRCRSA